MQAEGLEPPISSRMPVLQTGGLPLAYACIFFTYRGSVRCSCAQVPTYWHYTLYYFSGADGVS